MLFSKAERNERSFEIFEEFAMSVNHSKDVFFIHSNKEKKKKNKDSRKKISAKLAFPNTVNK